LIRRGRKFKTCPERSRGIPAEGGSAASQNFTIISFGTWLPETEPDAARTNAAAAHKITRLRIITFVIALIK
jgi:hypothetical protein